MCEQIWKEWTNLKPKFNQLVQWKQAFPNETANQVKVRINTLQSSYNSANEQLNIVRNELEKERSWWDKWKADSWIFFQWNYSELVMKWPKHKNLESVAAYADHLLPFENKFKEEIYQYYRDK